MAPRISIPHEHGALLTLAGATIAAIAIAPHKDAAAGLALVLASAFLARGVLERVAVGAPMRAWDGAWCGLLASAAIGGELLALRGAAMIAGIATALAGLGLAGAALARRARLQRRPYVELVGLAALGGGAGLAALGGLTSIAPAIVLGAVLAAHAASSVPIVRAAVRAQRRPPGVAGAIAAIAVGLGACVALGRPWAALALAPRIVQMIGLVRAPEERVDPAVIGVRETALLAIVTVVAVVAAS